MADDIVTRLRNRAAEGWLEHDETCCPDCADDVAFGREMIAAAAEIELLGAALAIAAGMISTLPQYENQHPQTVMEMLLEEARRG